MADVEYTRDEVTALLPAYDLVRHCIEGETSVKREGIAYLPMPNAVDRSLENIAAYAAYKTRAVFYNVTNRTLNGFIGEVFSRDPVIEVPPLLDVVVKDATGDGVSVAQLSQQAVADALSYGRVGVLTDYPPTETVTTRADQLNGNVRPTLTLYKPWDCINWRTAVRGGKKVLTLVVLSESYDDETNEFSVETKKQYRVLRLDEAQLYRVDVYRETGTGWIVETTYEPTDGQGNRLAEIPFQFIGARNNDPAPDAPPLYDLASLNIGHYRNSADYEESAFICGQPTLKVVGLTEQWVENVLKNKPILIGSKSSILLPENADAGFIQVEPNTLAFEAMQHKERQMVALGAKLVEQRTTQRTATEAGLEKAAEDSVLATCARNVGSAFTWALEWCAIFMGARTVATDARNKSIIFDLNTEFDLTRLSSEDRKQIIEEWQKGAIAFEEMRAVLRRGGIATMTDEEARTKIAAEVAAAPDLGGLEIGDGEDE